MIVIKRDGTREKFSKAKVKRVIQEAYKSCGKRVPSRLIDAVLFEVTTINGEYSMETDTSLEQREEITVEEIQDIIEDYLVRQDMDVARSFIVYREKHKALRTWVENKQSFINKYKASGNTADATIDDNSNVASKNIGIMNNEIHKEDNIQISRAMITNKLKELYPNFDSKQYERDLRNHLIYKHDESSFAGAVAPYCCSISMYPFLNDGIKGIGGLSAAPKNLDSYCGMFINLIFATSSQFAGAVATSEFLVYFDYFARKEWGNDYYKNYDNIYKYTARREITIREQLHQYFQQVVYSINQPAAARGMQAAFVNFSYFDKVFFEGMFGNFAFPDGTQPQWESLNWLQKEFMMWFNEERTKCMLTFPVESFALVYQDGKFLDDDSAAFVAEEYARGHSFFTYISDSVDSLSSCCRLRNVLTTKEFNFTNGNMGIMTGSKSVITLNLNRIIQEIHRLGRVPKEFSQWTEENFNAMKYELNVLLERVYKYHIAYNELLKDMFDANLLPAYSAGFINLNKQYLTIGLNGLNEAAEFLEIELSNNNYYAKFCEELFSTIKEANLAHKTKELSFNTECVPAESLAIKNYNWDKEDGYWVPEDRNLYASYIYLPSDPNISILDKIKMHGSKFIGEYLDGGSAAHLNLNEHLDVIQYRSILEIAAKEGCQYFTFNVPNSECQDCGYITKQPIAECPHCGSKKISYYDRIIGYLTKIDNWSEGRREEQKTRVYHTMGE